MVGAGVGDVILLLQCQWTGVTDLKCTGKAAFGALHHHPSLMWLRSCCGVSSTSRRQNPPRLGRIRQRWRFQHVPAQDQTIDANINLSRQEEPKTNQKPTKNHCRARAEHTGQEHPTGRGSCTSPPMPDTGSEAANSLPIIINFMHILCKALVRRQDGIDLIRISIIEPFGWQLLIRESVKHRRGRGREGLSGAARNSELGWKELQPHPAGPSLGTGSAQDAAPGISLEREKAELKLQETQQVQEDALLDPCHQLSHSSSTSRAQGPLRAGGSPGEPGNCDLFQ